MNDEILRQFEDNRDGIVYIITIYKSGRMQKRRKEGYEKAITNTEATMLEMATDIKYVADLLEINEEVS